MSDNGSTAAPEYGRCMNCGLSVPLAQTFRPPSLAGQPQAPLRHRTGTSSKDPVGTTCGPVALALLYHVVAAFAVNGQFAMMDVTLKASRPPEENYQTVQDWKAQIQAGFQPAGDKGALLVNVQKPSIVITDWKLIGAEL